jgi:hypothetical protein
MVLYLLLCLVSVLAGCGILSLVGVNVDRRSTFFLTPLATLCSLAILMGGLVAGGFTIGEVTPALYTLCLGAALVGAVRHGKIVLAGWRDLLILAALPMLILLPGLVQGIENYSGGLCMDGWAYVTVGQSLQQYPLDSHGWLPPAVQFAASMGKTRFISMSFLALLAPLAGAHNDTQEVLGHYVGWLFFVFGSTCIFFAKAARLGRSSTWMFLFLVLLSGWSLRLINANSLDNTLALCFLPAVFGLLIAMPGPSVGQGIALGAIMAAGLYAYPESSPFTFAAILVVSAQRLIAAPSQVREFWRMSVAFVITMAVCIAPYATAIVSFFGNQTTALMGAIGARPGEGFYRLLLTRGYILASYCGLATDFSGRNYAEHYHPYALAVAYILIFAALAGMFVLLRRKEWSLPLFAVGMTAAYATFLLRMRYSYGGYKVLVLAWFVVAYLVVVAGEFVWQKLGRSSRGLVYTLSGVGLGLLAAVGGFFFLQERIFYQSLGFKSVRDFKKVSALDNHARGRPVAMIVNDTHANLWGAHFLRHTKLYFGGQYRGYMADKPIMDQSEPVNPADIRYVVTDDRQSFLTQPLFSHLGPYYIWDFGPRPWVLVTEIDNPFGLDRGGEDDTFLWIAKTYTAIEILSRIPAHVLISAEFTVQASAGDKPRQWVRVGTAAGGFAEERDIGNGTHSFDVPLQPGLNRVLLRSIEKAPPLIRAAHLRVSLAPENDSVEILDVETPNGIESSSSVPFFWMGGNDTSVTISAPTAGVAHLTATLVPGRSLVDKSKARLSIISRSGVAREQDLNWGTARIDVPVQAGLNKIAMRALGPTAAVPGDARTMMIGFRNLQPLSVEGTSKSK